jgi:hypothetical protein
MPRGISPLDAAWIERRLWTPALLETPPEQWFEAADPNSLTLDGSGNASQWNDLSGKGNHATQSTAGSRPTWDPVGMLGAPCLKQISGSKSLVHSATPGTGPATGWILVMNTTSPLSVTAYLTAPPSTKWGMHLRSRVANGGWAATFVDDSTERSANTLTISQPNILVAAYDGSTGYRYYTNGGPVETKTLTPYGGNASPRQQLFADADATNCIISACGFSKAALSEIDCLRLAGYLAWRYNAQARLDPSNPYANKPPEIGQ